MPNWVVYACVARWQVASVIRIDVVRLTWLLVILSLVRGYDYATGNDSVLAQIGPPGKALGYQPQSSLIGIEGAFPLWLWALGFLLWGALLTVGLAWQRHSAIWLGHLMLSALYAGLAIGLAYGYLERPWFDGIRNATVLLLPCLLHALLWWRMGPMPDCDRADVDC